MMMNQRRKTQVMQTLVEAASHIAQEIERTRQHLTNLEQALQGLRPLITIDAATTALPFTATPAVQTVEDASIVNTKGSVEKVVKPKSIAKVKSVIKRPMQKIKSAKVKTKSLPTESVKLPSTGAELWLNCLGRKKLSTAELIEEAMKKLDLDASARVVIANRARAWLNASAKSGAVIVAGTRDGTNLFKRAVEKSGKGSKV
jgi:hypothetical protein